MNKVNNLIHEILEISVVISSDKLHSNTPKIEDQYSDLINEREMKLNLLEKMGYFKHLPMALCLDRAM